DSLRSLQFGERFVALVFKNSDLLVRRDKSCLNIVPLIFRRQTRLIGRGKRVFQMGDLCALDQASRKTVFREGGLESIFVLKLFTLLGGEIGFQKNFARIILLSQDDAHDAEQKQQGEPGPRASPNAMVRRHNQPAAERYPVHRRRELAERSGKVESFVCKKRF